MAGADPVEEPLADPQAERNRRINKQSAAFTSLFAHTDRTHCNNPETNILTVCLSAFSNEFPSAFRGKKFESQEFQDALINFIKTWLNEHGDVKFKIKPELDHEEFQTFKKCLIMLEEEGLLGVHHFNCCLQYLEAKYKKREFCSS